MLSKWVSLSSADKCDTPQQAARFHAPKHWPLISRTLSACWFGDAIHLTARTNKKKQNFMATIIRCFMQCVRGEKGKIKHWNIATASFHFVTYANYWSDYKFAHVPPPHSRGSARNGSQTDWLTNWLTDDQTVGVLCFAPVYCPFGSCFIATKRMMQFSCTFHMLSTRVCTMESTALLGEVDNLLSELSTVLSINVPHRWWNLHNVGRLCIHYKQTVQVSSTKRWFHHFSF